MERGEEAGKPDERVTQEGYEPPAVTVLGSFAELTRGVIPTSTDGVLPGSVL